MHRNGRTGKTKSHVPSLYRGIQKDTKDNGISPLISQAKTRLRDFDQIFELQSLSKTVFIVSQVRKLQNQFLQHNFGDGTLPQAIHGGTRPTGAGGAHNKCLSDLFVTVGFVYSRWRSTVTDGWCRQIHLIRHFTHAHCARLIM